MKNTKRIVVALGGNALGNNLEEQRAAVGRTAGVIASLVRAGHEVVVTHGNGPQVGMIHLAMEGRVPLSVSVAMSQSYIGFDLQNALQNEGVRAETVVTQVVVDQNDPAFRHPTKPIGRFMTREEAAAKPYPTTEDAGRGYRQIVASPQPIEIVEIDAVRALIAAGETVITCGGGGIPVVRENGRLCGVDAVIDKDFASEKLAEGISADWLVILTAVEHVALDFGKPTQRNVSRMTVSEAAAYIAEGQFAPGSMLPKVEAARRFAASGKDRRALITLLERAADGMEGKTGTVVEAE